MEDEKIIKLISEALEIEVSKITREATLLSLGVKTNYDTIAIEEMVDEEFGVEYDTCVVHTTVGEIIDFVKASCKGSIDD